MQLNENKKNIRILLADDNYVNQHVALRILSKLGYTADAVGSGVEVIQALEHHRYDLILMDCQMPEMDGFNATKKIRTLKEPHLKNIPIIAMTAFALKGDREKCIQSGMNDYIPKPIDINILAKTLDRWLQKI